MIIDLHSTGNFPHFDLNLNAGGDNHNESEGVVATNAVHHSRNRASYIVLPVIP